MNLQLFAQEASEAADWIPAQYVAYIVVALAVIKAAEVISNLTPNKTDDKWVAAVRKFFSVVALKVPDVEKVQKKEPKK